MRSLHFEKWEVQKSLLILNDCEWFQNEFSLFLCVLILSNDLSNDLIRSFELFRPCMIRFEQKWDKTKLKRSRYKVILSHFVFGTGQSNESMQSSAVDFAINFCSKVGPGHVRWGWNNLGACLGLGIACIQWDRQWMDYAYQKPSNEQSGLYVPLTPSMPFVSGNLKPFNQIPM